MYCMNCGRQIPENADFCPYCGLDRRNVYAYNEEKPPRKSPFRSKAFWVIFFLGVVLSAAGGAGFWIMQHWL